MQIVNVYEQKNISLQNLDAEILDTNNTTI